MSDDAWWAVRVLEGRLEDDPDSMENWRELLTALYTPHLVVHPRRVEYIAEFVRRFPRYWIARTPFVSVDVTGAPVGFQQVEREWVKHWDARTGDSEIARGFAAFLASRDWMRAIEILRQSVEVRPSDPDLWTDMGRIAPDAAQRLEFLQRARSLGASQPNLLAWIAGAAADAGNIEVAADVGTEMLDLAGRARAAYGDVLDWPDRGRDLWLRTRARTGNDTSARQLVAAISDHAHQKHWGHTALGVVALRRGDTSGALEHLRESANVVGEPRLSSYGPSFRLAREVAALGEWSAVDCYLRSCQTFWDPEEMDEWIAAIARQQIPNFPNQ